MRKLISVRGRGFSLIELLVSMFIFGLIVSGFFALLRAADMNWSIAGGLLDLQQQSRQAMDEMVKELRNAVLSENSIVDGGARINFYIFKDVNKIAEDSYLASYYLLNNQIIKEYSGNINKVLANNITNLNFCCLGGLDCFDCSSAKNLRIQAQASKTVQNRVLNFSLTERVRLRNE